MKNKMILISFLRDNLRDYGLNISDATADADTFIAKVAAPETRNGSDVVVHVDDVNIFCLLMQGSFRRSALSNFQ